MKAPASQDRPDVKCPPPLMFLVLLAVAGLLEYWAGFGSLKGAMGWRGALALFLSLFAGYLALHAVMVLKGRGTFVDPAKPTLHIVAAGPFKFSRNPMYLSLLLVLSAIAIARFSPWFALATIALWCLLERFAVQPEEEYLTRKFGGQYLAYKERVRRWL